MARYNTWYTFLQGATAFNERYVEDPGKLQLYLDGQADADSLDDLQAIQFSSIMRNQFNLHLMAFKANRSGVRSDSD